MENSLSLPDQDNMLSQEGDENNQNILLSSLLGGTANSSFNNFHNGVIFFTAQNIA